MGLSKEHSVLPRLVTITRVCDLVSSIFVTCAGDGIPYGTLPCDPTFSH